MAMKIRILQFAGLQKLLLLPIVLQLLGCSIPLVSGYGAEKRSREEFSQYVEEVFKLQNNITSRIMLLMSNVDFMPAQPLVDAEQHMQQLCSPVNEYAARELDGLHASFLLQSRVEKSIENCDKAAQEVEKLLNNL